MVLKPRTVSGRHPVPERAVGRRPHDPAPPVAAIADEPRPFREFLGEHLRRLGFDVEFFETGEPTLDFVRRIRADLVIVNVYLKGKLGVEVTEEIKADPALANTRVILIGASSAPTASAPTRPISMAPTNTSKSRSRRKSSARSSTSSSPRSGR